MNIREARSILELSEGVSQDEAKKKYRELTKKYHPDINKEPGAEDKFKKINEAYQVVSTGKSTDREEPQRQSTWNPFATRGPIGFSFHKEKQVEIIHIHSTISFYDSVVGSKSELKYKRETKCNSCEGQGVTAINNGCDKCGGKGKIVSQQNNVFVIRDCDKCMGRMKTQSCPVCSASGVLESDVSVNVTIPAGIENDNILRLSGMGNFAGNFGPIEQYSDVYLHIKVTPEPGLSIEGADVVSTLNLSLLEALKGCKKNVKTIMGDKEINIKPMSRNKEEISIPRLGVSKIGSQRIILDVQYPDDIDKLINSLEN